MLRNRFRYRLTTLLAITALVAVACAWPQMRLAYLCWSMSNDDITKLADAGVSLQCDGPTAIIVSEYGLKARPKLRTLLSDPNRFAAAHAAMTEITGVRTAGTIGPPPGRYIANNLNYELSESGNLSFDISQNKHLAGWWTDYVGNHTGIQIWDEESEELVWYSDWKENVR